MDAARVKKLKTRLGLNLQELAIILHGTQPEAVAWLREGVTGERARHAEHIERCADIVEAHVKPGRLKAVVRLPSLGLPYRSVLAGMQSDAETCAKHLTELFDGLPGVAVRRR
jgi:hypothetical protein